MTRSAAPFPRGAGLLGIAILAAPLALAMERGALSSVPEMLRIALALFALVALPGLAWQEIGVGVRRGFLIDLVPALGFGAAWNAVLILGLRAAGRPFTDLAWLGPGITVVLCGVSVLRARSRPRVPPAGHGALGRGAAIAIVLAAALASLHAGRIGAPMAYYSDSPDHVGSIRRMLQTGDAFPTDAFFKNAGREGTDPRKGLWHPQVALIAKLADVDPADAWRQLPAWLAPIFVLNLAALGLLAAGSRGAAIFAWAQLLVLAGSIRWFPLAKSVFSTFLADQWCLAVAIAALADRRMPSRAARVGVSVLAFAAVTTHVYSSIQLALTLGALALVSLAASRRWRGDVARLTGTAALAGVVMLPYLLWRAGQFDAPANVIHTESQGLMVIAGTWRVVAVGVLWDWMGKLWVLFPLAWIPLAKRLRDDDAALYAFAVSVAVALVIFDPIAVAILEPRLGYLLMRMIWMVPIGALVGWSAMRLGARLLTAEAAAKPVPAWRSPRIAAALGLAGLALLLAPTARDAVATWTDPSRFSGADRRESPMRWADGMRWMEDSLPPGQVVLSDPATSYGVPMLTHHYVETLVDQHSSPSDSLALRRILDARDALDPYSPWSRTREVIRRHGVTVIVVNDDFAVPPRLDYWAPDPAWAAAARARLDREPGAFERVHDRGGFTIYRVHDDALDSLSSPIEARPMVVPYESGRFPIGRRFEDDVPVLHRLTLWPLRIARGDTLTGVADWRSLAPLPAGSYLVSVRFDRPLPGDFSPPAAIAKPARKLLEKLRNERYRFREDHVPASGVYGVDLWRPDEIVRDTFHLAVPGDVAPGYYQVEVRIHRSPHYPNLRLADYFLDRDYFSGVVMGRIEVVTSREALSRPPAPLPESFEGGH